jgi:hypothetical protein
VDHLQHSVVLLQVDVELDFGRLVSALAPHSLLVVAELLQNLEGRLDNSLDSPVLVDLLGEVLVRLFLKVDAFAFARSGRLGLEDVLFLVVLGGDDYLLAVEGLLAVEVLDVGEGLLQADVVSLRIHLHRFKLI